MFGRASSDRGDIYWSKRNGHQRPRNPRPLRGGPAKELNSHIERAIDTSSFDDVIVTSQLYLWRLLVFLHNKHLVTARSMWLLSSLVVAPKITTPLRSRPLSYERQQIVDNFIVYYSTVKRYVGRRSPPNLGPLRRGPDYTMQKQFEKGADFAM